MCSKRKSTLSVESLEKHNILHFKEEHKLITEDMPALAIQTSATLPADTTPILRRLSSALANILSKPEGYVMITLNKVDAIMFGGDASAPAAFCNLHSIGAINRANNAKVSQAICTILNEVLAVPQDRVYIQFYDSQASNFGFDGSVF
eukprot:gene450-487_t